MFVSHPSCHCLFLNPLVIVCFSPLLSLFVSQPSSHCLFLTPLVIVCVSPLLSLFVSHPSCHCCFLTPLVMVCFTPLVIVCVSPLMIFEKGRHTSCDMFLNNVKLEVVQLFKYLGVHFFKNGNWFRTQKRLANHASRALHNLFALFRQLDLPMSEQCKLFDILVGSISNYSSEVWGMHDAKDIEVIHTKFCCWILNVKKSTNLSALYGELGRVPFIIQRKFNMIKYCVKLLKSNDSFLPKKMYRILKDDADSGNSYNGSNWASYIESLLDNLGLSYIWLQQGEIDIPLQLIKPRIFYHYYQTWYTDINNSKRRISYARF